MLTALDLVGMPLHVDERTIDGPIVLAGGHSAFNPEPNADCIDAAVIGDDEEVVLLITGIIKDWKTQGRPGGRRGLLMARARTGSIYVPSMYRVDYLPEGRIQRVVLTEEARIVPWRVSKHTVMDLEEWP